MCSFPLYSAHGLIVECKTYICTPNLLTHPACQHFLWEETGVPGETPRLSTERWPTLHMNVLSPEWEWNLRSDWLLLWCPSNVPITKYMYDVCGVTPSVHSHRASWTVYLTTVGIEPTTFGIPVQCSTNWYPKSRGFDSHRVRQTFFSLPGVDAHSTNIIFTWVHNTNKQKVKYMYIWIQVQFLKKAVKILSMCRNTLKYTYVFAFYLQKNNQTVIFEVWTSIF